MIAKVFTNMAFLPTLRLIFLCGLWSESFHMYQLFLMFLLYIIYLPIKAARSHEGFHNKTTISLSAMAN